MNRCLKGLGVVVGAAPVECTPPSNGSGLLTAWIAGLIGVFLGVAISARSRL